MIRNKCNLYIFTREYPLGKQEQSFLNPELEVLKEYYNIKIIPCHTPVQSESDIKRLEDKLGVSIIQYNPLYSSWIPKMWDCICGLCTIEFWKEVLYILKSESNCIKRLLYSLSVWTYAQKFSRWIKLNCLFGDISETHGILYTFWTTEVTLALLQVFPNEHVICRFHGIDLYDDRLLVKRQPFRWLINQKASRLFFVSQSGMNYYIQRHKDTLALNSVALARLGVCVKDANNPQKGNSFTIVSCSELIPIKRIDLIVRALKMFEQEQIRWIHFGSGELEGEIRSLAIELLENKENVSYVFMGQTENDDILKYYQEEQVDCFITVTESEGGCPVSIQEAMSFGIPIIGTDVSDIPFMISGNGILLPKEVTVEEIKKAILTMMHLPNNEVQRMRSISKEKQRLYFNSTTNSLEFLKYLLELQ